MPHFSTDQIRTEKSDGQGNPCGPYRALLLSDTGGLTQFGAFIETLLPGSRSSLKHWHQSEDEMIYMLEGTVTLHEGTATALLRAGDTATFKAGTPIGHCLENTGTTDARYLVIGTRSAQDVVTYPDHDRVLHLDRPQGTRSYTDRAGRPADSPYKA
jgi:uncharacterized cupin superfamily protein